MSEILCKECSYSDPSDTWTYKIHCDYYHTYEDPLSTCSHAIKRGYYVSTAICEMLGKNQDEEVPSTIRNFSIGVMQTDKEKIKYVKAYDEIGPKLAECLVIDGDIEFVKILYDKCLVPVVENLKDNKFNKAISLYVDMVNSLENYYNIDRDCQINLEKQLTFSNKPSII